MIDETLLEADDKMDKAIEVAKEDFATIRTGRANPGMFSRLTVDYYGSPTPLQQLASFHTPEARTMLITPYDKSAMAAIEKALRDSDLGVNPTNDGNLIRVSLPELTEERRKEYIKLARHKGEDARVSIRNIRRKAKEELDRISKDGEAGEDEVARAEKELEALHQEARRHHRRAARAQGVRAAGGLTSSGRLAATATGPWTSSPSRADGSAAPARPRRRGATADADAGLVDLAEDDGADDRVIDADRAASRRAGAVDRRRRATGRASRRPRRVRRPRPGRSRAATGRAAPHRPTPAPGRRAPGRAQAEPGRPQPAGRGRRRRRARRAWSSPRCSSARKPSSSSATLAIVVAVWELTEALAVRQIAVPLVPVAVGAVGMLVAAFAAGGQALAVCFALTCLGVAGLAGGRGPRGRGPRRRRRPARRGVRAAARRLHDAAALTRTTGRGAS